jgi:membrane protease YdiL (CAAX protease family)
MNDERTANILDRRRIIVYLVFAFGIAWAGGLAILLTGGLVNSAPIPGTGLTYAFLLITTVYMGAPALAHVLTRLVTREGWRDTYLRPNLRQGWPYWAIAWFAPGLLTFVGAALFFALFPQYYDPSLSRLREALQQSAASAPGQALPEINPWVLLISGAVQAMLIAPILNALPILGEEFGWRAYLQPRLMPLGGRKAMLLMGLIWGVWHWPVIAMGHNFGLDYPGAPWLGMLVMVWFTLTFGTLAGWLALRGRSVWPAVIAHGAINGIAGITVFLTQDAPNPLLGPLPVGLIGSAGFTLVALLLFLWPGALDAPAPLPAPEAMRAESVPEPTARSSAP